jgi:hypothetical protein
MLAAAAHCPFCNEPQRSALAPTLARLACASLLLGAVQLACVGDDDEDDGACLDGRMLVLGAEGAPVLAACGEDTADGGDYGEGSTYAGPDEDSSIYPTEDSWTETHDSASTLDPSTSTSEGSTGTSTGCAIDESSGGGCVESSSEGSSDSSDGSDGSDSGTTDTGGSGSSDAGPS